MKFIVSKSDEIMRADDLILFAQVVDCGSFSLVAEQLNVTNSVVSKRISRLEQDLGVQLLYRTTRKLSLTEAGTMLLTQARHIHAATQEAFDSVAGMGEQISGTLRLSVPTISGELLLAEAVAKFCRMHPQLRVDMSLDNRFVDVVAEGFDLVIRTGQLNDSSLIARHLVESEWLICVSPSYLAQFGTPNAPEELSQHNCALYHQSGATADDWNFRRDGKDFSVKVSGQMRLDNGQALRRIALSGEAIVFLPRVLVYEDLLAGKLVELFPGQVQKTLGIYAVYPFTRKAPYKIRCLIEFLREQYQRKRSYFNSQR